MTVTVVSEYSELMARASKEEVKEKYASLIAVLGIPIILLLILAHLELVYKLDLVLALFWVVSVIVADVAQKRSKECRRQMRILEIKDMLERIDGMFDEGAAPALIQNAFGLAQLKIVSEFKRDT